jgi:hypothetical protein
VKEIEARQLLPVILNLAAAVSRLTAISALLAADRKSEVEPLVRQAREDVEKILAAAQRFVDEASADDAL